MLDIKTLNPSQARVISSPAHAHILSVAGPGSGKTRTITYRLGHLVTNCDILPSRLRAVTFTKAATQEMKARLRAIDTSLNAVQITTIHNLCRYIIKETQGATIEGGDFTSYVEGETAFKEMTPEKAILDALVKFLESDSDLDHTKRMYYQIAEKLKLALPSSPREAAEAFLAPNPAGNPAEILGQYITYQKTARHCQKYIPDAKRPAFSFEYACYVLPSLPKSVDLRSLCDRVYEHYCKILTEWKLLDFTDQIIFAHLGLLLCSERTRLAFESKWDVIAVDEFQDVDAVQFEVFRLLCAGDTKLNAVGDPDQAIYGFRGGDARFISEFKKWFPDAEIVKLDTNYRSHTEIIDVAYSAVESIAQPHRAKGESAKGKGGLVKFAYEKEARDFSISDGTVGMLAWTNKTLNQISGLLLQNGIVCSVNTRWNNHLNVSKPVYRAVYQTLQALDMMAGEIAFNRDMFLKYAQDMKGVGPAVMKVEGSTLAELQKSPKIAGYVRFLRMIKRLDTPNKVTAILNTGTFSINSKVARRNVAALATLDFSETYQEVLDSTKIKLYTIHRAKGLEFDTVFVDTTDFAKRFASENPDESKRLLFVALSRAKQNLLLLGSEDQGNTITASVIRKVCEIQNQVEDSRFFEIPEGMPLTNRLDKMTRPQALWSLENGDAWVKYLRSNGHIHGGP